ncbi:hypothetical protein [Streptomyces armeniacus]|uniref:hypothetical protein n=1 Tax=Streptomyces armeniacus TaxID=83291 RepID=UPI001AD83B3C|nr:hypothetical protein [Streptomyces armeniacus]
MIAVLVTLLIVVSGVTAFALLGDLGGGKDKGAQEDSKQPDRGSDGSPKDDADVDSSTNDPSNSPSESGNADEIPSEMVGQWRRTFGTGDANVFVLNLEQGKLGDTVVTITGEGPTYSCEFQADLTSYGPPVGLGPSRVTFESSDEDCAEGPTTELELTNSGQLRRSFSDGRAPQIFSPAD